MVRKSCILVFAVTIVFVVSAGPQKPGGSAAKGTGTPEQRAARAMESVRSNPLELRAFLERMPKGADLHMHLSGAIYAETFIRDAVQDQLCVNTMTFSLVEPQSMSTSTPPQPVCGDKQVPASQAYTNQHLYDALINNFSMRSFVPSPGVSGHDHFFDAFAKYGAIHPRHIGEWADEVATRAAAQNEQYLELMTTPPFTRAQAVAGEIAWSEDFAQLREKELAAGLRDDVAVAHTYFDQIDSLRRELERCGQPGESAACKVQTRFVYQVFRSLPKQAVFAQTLLAFEIASADPRMVAVNFVAPEDGYTSMNDYALHMRIVGFLHSVYPKVHITLHAGELAPGLVPYEGLCCHIRQAVEEAHAERIGHGVDVMYEERPYDLMRELAAKHIMVEVNLSSNDLILGVSGKEHPFTIYRKFHVPVSLSTDDEGVSRIDLTHEYVRAVQTYGLSYNDLKQMVRTGAEHSFLPGASVWSGPDEFGHVAAACSGNSPGADKPTPACDKFLQASEKARLQWEVEKRFREFEASF